MCVSGEGVCNSKHACILTLSERQSPRQPARPAGSGISLKQPNGTMSRAVSSPSDQHSGEDCQYLHSLREVQ